MMVLSEQEVEAILENMSDGLLILNSSLVIEYANIQSSKNLNQDHLPGKSFYEIFPGASSSLKKLGIDDLLSLQQPISFETSLGDSKSPNNFSIQIQPFNLRFFVILRLFAEPNAVKDSPSLAWAQLRTIIESIPDEVAFKDCQRRFLLANSASVQALKQSSEADVLGKRDEDLLPLHVAQVHVREEEEIIATGKSILNFENTKVDSTTGEVIGCKLISKVPVRNPRGDIIGLLVVNRSITERKRYLVALKESEELFRKVIESTGEGVALLSKDGRFILVNLATEELFGLSRSQLLSRSLFDCISPNCSEHLKSELFKRKGKQASTFELEIHRSDGSKRMVLVTATSVLQTDGSYAGSLGIFRDMTEHKRTEEALRETQKMKSLGILAGGIAHDFNNLLQAVLGHASLALQRLDRHHAAYANIQKLETAAMRASELTQQLLAYSGRGKFQTTPIFLNTFIRDNLHFFEVSIPKYIQLHTALAADLPHIEADSGQIQQIVMNLIINATEAIGDRAGNIHIATSSLYIPADDRACWVRAGEELDAGTYVLLDVHDDGSGMAEETQQRIFDPFFSTKFTGRGLGLAAVLGIIRGHKGGIQVQSNVGVGTTFRIALPAVQSFALNERKSMAEEKEITGAILVIDDEEYVRDLVADILDTFHIAVVTAENGEGGLSIYSDHRDKISAVLLDLSMPGIGGEETFKRLKALNPNVKVILSSGYSEVEAVERFAGQGLAGFLQKPYKPELLISVLKSQM
ncbi:MAG: PAS domain-containing protein [bacterium]